LADRPKALAKPAQVIAKPGQSPLPDAPKAIAEPAQGDSGAHPEAIAELVPELFH